MRVDRVRNPAAFLVPSFLDLITVMAVHNGLGESSATSVVETFMSLAEEPTAAILVGSENGKLLSFVLVQLPKTSLDVKPQVTYWYNQGSNALKRAMGRKTVAFITAAGYNSCWAINFTGKPDSVWLRSLRVFGKGRPVGSIAEFQFASEAGKADDA